ncbi:DUF6443 domain-containing protein, partial [Algoriphagus marincola]|uniref:DUF6443 domain-containing protein n=1 Tax=Algoriphagus marincola TaxID=264027 RepID=UPI00047DFE29
MKKFLIILLAMFTALKGESQNIPNSVSSAIASNPESLAISSIGSSTNINVVRELTFNQPLQLVFGNLTKEQAQTVTYYFDGLGRPLQEVFFQISPTGKDWVKPYTYDAFGRVKYGLLAYPSTTTAGKIIQNPGSNYTGRLASVYNGEGNFFTRLAYENSPKDKVLKSSSPGNSWSGSNRGLESTERMNSTSDYIRKFEIAPGQTTPTYLGTYGNNELFVNRTIDEDGKISETFTNYLGQKILSRTAAISSPGTGFSHWLWTYYIYDHKGRLVYTLMPEGTHLCNSAQNWNIEASTIKGHYFKYFYDSRDRVYQKKIPGADISEYVFDHLDRVVMERNGLHEESGYWMVYKYNDFNEISIVGRLNSTSSRATFQSNVDANSDYIANLSLSSTDQSNIFGNYSFAGTTHTFNSSFNSQFTSPPKPTKAIHRRLTGKRLKIDGTGLYITEVYFYDDRGNLIQKKVLNHKGGTDWTTFEYDFRGNITKSYHVQNNPSAGSNSTITVLKTFTYDHANRLLSISQKVNSRPEQTLVSYSYDELGQLVEKDWNGLQTVDYKYNPRGWLTHINDPNLSQSGDTFGMQIFYDFGYGSVNYNGNISGIQWKSSRDGMKRSFGFNYDQLNRISQGHYVRFGTSWNQESGRYSLSGITYDRNGNINTLNRQGKTSNPGSFGAIDQLTYSYAFNRVTKIEDGISSSFGFGDFKNGANVTTEYEYNDAGSIKRDRNKGITSISYNFNNLPRVIQFGSSS